MSKLQKTLLIIATLLLGFTFVFPLWEISLFAPQYPEGLFMQIWLDKISGNVEQINILNHYIGMKAIHADSIPELTYLPKLVMGLMVFGLLSAFSKNRKISIGYAMLFLAVALFFLYDFYKWEYDYGHDLNPDAAIKVPGMHYQPPLIGVKTLLNISAYSLPGVGGYALTISLVLWLATPFIHKWIPRD